MCINKEHANLTCLYIRLSVHLHEATSFPLNSFYEIWYMSVFRKSVQKIQVSLKSEKNNEYFTWRPIYIFFIITRLVLLRMGNVSDKSCRQNQNTYFMLNNISSENHFVYMIMWKNKVQPDSPQMTIYYGVCIFHTG